MIKILGNRGISDGNNRWDDDVIFKNQARGTEDKGKKKEFVNVSPFLLAIPVLPYTDFIPQDLLRSDFHKRFMRLVKSSFIQTCPDFMMPILLTFKIAST